MTDSDTGESKMFNKIFVVMYQFADTKDKHISQEAYRNLREAQEFIASREDKPNKITDYIYSSFVDGVRRTYYIFEVRVK